MPKWKVTTRDEREDDTPSREFMIEADTQEDAAEKAVASSKPWGKVVEVELVP